MRNNVNLLRLGLFLAVGFLHVLLILFMVIKMETAARTPPEPVAAVMKLTDLMEEDLPPEPPPPPPPAQEQPENAVESIAENMIETDEPPDQVVVAPGTLITSSPPVQYAPQTEENYLPMHRISSPPVFAERDIKAALVYPPIAQRSGLEGMVYLELFIDRQGMVRQITVLKEDPADRGFADAAIKAFMGLRGKPAEANGAAVAVRYRYPVRFSLR